MERPGGYLFDFLENRHLFFWPMPGCTTEDGNSEIERHTIEVREQEEDTCMSYADRH